MTDADVVRTGGHEGSAWRAICRSQAVIEFDLSGRIIWANDIFLAATGYRLEEITGRHHRIFCTPAYASSSAYANFWAKLGRGEFDAGEYKRIGKDGREIWLQATYNPIFDGGGRPNRILKIASDISAAKLRSAALEARATAIDRSLGAIEFALDGTILDANANFLSATGYELFEIIGKHHRIFCTEDHRRSPEYRAFWEKLGKGEFDAGVYKRVTKDGGDLWLQATYNPILDPDGKPIKIVKLATDITLAKVRSAECEGMVNAVDRSQAVIEFDLRGNILDANGNFLSIFGYERGDLIGHHHRILCEEAETRTVEYQRFWQTLVVASSTPAVIAAATDPDRSSGSRRPIIRSSMPRANRGKSSRSRAT